MQSNTDAEERSFHDAPGAALSDPPGHARLLSLESSNQINAGPHLSAVSLRHWSLVSTALASLSQNQSGILLNVNAVLLRKIASLELEERKQWTKRHQGTPLDRDQLLREVNHEAKESGDRLLLEMLDMLRVLREQITEGLARYQEQFQAPSLAQKLEPIGPKTLCDASRSWAVIIGIDAYEHLDRLNGCVNDAMLVHEFLTDNLKIPYGHVNILTTDQDSLDSQRPTRDNIIHALYDLRDNSDIHFNDDIIIYFSGHGTRYKPSALNALSEQVGHINALCAVDHGLQVPGISDRELSRLIQEIYQTKGRNIVVILDACYSGGMARGSDAPGMDLVARNANYLWDGQDLEHMLHAADDHPRKESKASVFSPLWTPKSAPCIFLAACRSGERAWERRLGRHNRIHGVFTYTLVEALKLTVRGRRTTYADVEAKLAVLLSHPQAPTGLQHAYFAGDGSRELWYQVYGWVQGSVSMALAHLLLTALGNSLCRMHQPKFDVGRCKHCQATHQAFEAFDAQVESSVDIHPELHAVREKLRRLRKAAGKDQPVMEQSSMPELNPPGSNVLRGFLSLPIYVTSVPNLNFPESEFQELRKMMDAAELQAQNNETQ